MSIDTTSEIKIPDATRKIDSSTAYWLLDVTNYGCENVRLDQRAIVRPRWLSTPVIRGVFTVLRPPQDGLWPTPTMLPGTLYVEVARKNHAIRRIVLTKWRPEPELVMEIHPDHCPFIRADEAYLIRGYAEFIERLQFKLQFPRV